MTERTDTASFHLSDHGVEDSESLVVGLAPDRRGGVTLRRWLMKPRRGGSFAKETVLRPKPRAKVTTKTALSPMVLL